MTTLRHLLLLLALLALGACHPRDHATAVVAGGDTPESATRQSVALIRAGDFAGFWRHALPPQDYAMLRADWGPAHTAAKPLDPAARARIDGFLHQLAAPDAAATLDTRLQPWLAQTQERYGDQLPLLVGVARALASRSISDQPGLSDEQKHHAIDLLDTLAPWAQQAPWFDPDKARQAVGVVVATGRRLDLRDADSLRTTDFDQAMQHYGTAFAGLKQLLALYGLPIDPALASAHVVPLDYHPPYARVRIEYQLLGQPLSMESTLVLQDGRWYDLDLLQNVRAAHRRLVDPAPPAGAASAQPATVTAAR